MFFSNRDEGALKSAFTLIELLTVIVIVALLAAMALGGVKGVKDRAAIGRAKTELAALAAALENYRRHYGDYPQTGAAAQAEVLVEAAPVRASDAQALLFNALTGVFGSADFAVRLNGPMFLDVGRFQLEDRSVLTSASWAIPAGSPPRKAAIANALLDPWGRRYIYFYKAATSPAAWRATSYRLYSAGPDGKHVPPDEATGLYQGTTQAQGANADNLDSDNLP